MWSVVMVCNLADESPRSNAELGPHQYSEGMEGPDGRELTYFVAVAEELSFSRAAERLGIAQPPLSRAIRQLERRLGVTLFERTSRKVSLTAAGEVLLVDGRRALEALEAAGRRAQRAGRAEASLVLAMKAGGDGGLLPGILATYAETPDALTVDIVCSFTEREAMLRDGRADVGLLHKPRNDLRGLDHEDLVSERQVAVLPADHRLAAKSVLSLADLRGEPTPRWPGVDEASGLSISDAVVEDAGQLTQLIALGRAVAVVPESVAPHLRRDLVCVPVTDAPMTTMVVAWPEGSRSPAVAAFVRAAVAFARRTPEVRSPHS
jgi:DNA-binding transcriptional LysR family regulator